MTLDETVRVLAVVVSLWPQMRLEAATPDAWHHVLGDLPAADVEAAVIRLGRVQERPPSTATIRREVARAAGALAPDPDAALQSLLDVTAHDGEGRSTLHPTVRGLYDALGGCRGIRDASPGTLRAQFRDLYAAASERHDRGILGGGALAPMLEARSRGWELPRGSE